MNILNTGGLTAEQAEALFNLANNGVLTRIGERGKSCEDLYQWGLHPHTAETGSARAPNRLTPPTPVPGAPRFCHPALRTPPIQSGHRSTSSITSYSCCGDAADVCSIRKRTLAPSFQ
jgi:hypothetical protein